MKQKAKKTKAHTLNNPFNLQKDDPEDQRTEYAACVTGGGKLSLLKTSKDKDKRRKKREKKKEKKRQREEEKIYYEQLKNANKPEYFAENYQQMQDIATGQSSSGVPGPQGEGRRRFEKMGMSGTTSKNKNKTLAENLTRSEVNMIEVHQRREVKTLIAEASFSYKDRQDKYNKRAQTVTEINQMPALVMTKII